VQQSLRQSILEKQLAPGQKLPSESKLQAQFGVSRITVRQALSALQAEGLVETFNGKEFCHPSLECAAAWNAHRLL
jgi:GntR family transcriptional regulator